jgi:hypothetical protein
MITCSRILLELTDTDSYVSGDISSQKRQRSTDVRSKDLNKTLHLVDRQMRNLLIIAEQRHLPPSLIFAHEFTQAPLSLCVITNCDLMNQQKKSAAIDFLRSQYPTCFSNLCPNMDGTQALLIDGGSLLEIKPAGRSMTVRQYAVQLFKMVSVGKELSFNHVWKFSDCSLQFPSV